MLTAVVIVMVTAQIHWGVELGQARFLFGVMKASAVRPDPLIRVLSNNDPASLIQFSHRQLGRQFLLRRLFAFHHLCFAGLGVFA